MTKILLFLSVILAPGFVAGEVVTSLDDSQLEQLYQFCDQGDTKKAECDDQDEPIDRAFLSAFERVQSHVPSQIVLLSPSSFLSHYFIRAPPTSN